MEGIYVASHFTWLIKLINSLPLAWQQRLNPGIAVVTMYQDSNLPASELTFKRLSDEADILVGAGSGTVRNVLEELVFRVLDNCHVHRRLQSDLFEAMPNRSSDSTVFCSPHAPQREHISDSHACLTEPWPQDNSKRLQRYNIAFSRGTRQCAGINPAYAELFLMVSTFVRRYDMQLQETNMDSMKLFADKFLPFPKQGTQGVRVLRKSRAP
ncbi:hypothetical protein VTL71DRAFT_3803 [Oculimacula yallundae]|uniref:Cytochrome P450 n=1 Tax=Oculimacula yallundae TaxID=86028 RepID=A0ABR4C404_9HELO